MLLKFEPESRYTAEEALQELGDHALRGMPSAVRFAGL